MKRINNKGFTLVELLAVIVILAILVLVALPNVTGVMANARKSAFRTEALTMARDGAGMAYTNAMLGGVAITPGTNQADDGSGKVYKISGGEYMCITFNSLRTKGFIEKNNYTGYAGHVKLYNNGTTTLMYIRLTNGTYQINTDLETLAKATDIASVVTAGTSGPACPAIANASVTWDTQKTK